MMFKANTQSAEARYTATQWQLMRRKFIKHKLAVGSSIFLMLCYCIGMMGVLTPYATGPAPVYYASGFINRKDFWVLGFWFGMAFLVIYLAICSPYLGVL